MPIIKPTSPPPPSPRSAWDPLRRLARLARRPLDRLFRIEAASGILLIAAAVVALGWANSPWADGYLRLWQTPVGFDIGTSRLQRPLAWVVNDGLMVLFFFVVGMEIRREIHHGELSEWRRAALPATAALGGIVVPAMLYLAFAGAPSTRAGWGVPMATDIAFAVGILVLLGPRVPPALRVLLLAVAVIDDLGAIVVIAIFYSSGISLSGLGVAALGIAAVMALQRLRVRAKLAYVVPAVVVWGGVAAAGIHPTIAGVIVGVLTPVTPWPEADETPGEEAGDLAQSPAESLIERLHPWVAFGIMPVFALANAGVVISGQAQNAASYRVTGAVLVGLLFGKPMGILLACWLTLRVRLGVLPEGVSGRHLVVLGLVAGVGFTMSLFIAQLAFAEGPLLAAAKLGVLAASGSAAVLTVVVGRWLLPPVADPGGAESADEAESSTEL